MDQGVAAVLAACVAGVSGAAGASAGARASGRTTQRQAEHDYALQARQAMAADIKTTCEAYHERGLAALQAVMNFEAEVCEGRDGAREEDEFRQSFRIFMMGAHRVGLCRLELEEPASRWYAEMQKVADALRALRDDPAAATDPASPGRQQLLTAWARHKTTVHTFWVSVQEARKAAVGPIDT